MASKKIKSFTLPYQQNHRLNDYKPQHEVSTSSTYYKNQKQQQQQHPYYNQQYRSSTRRIENKLNGLTKTRYTRQQPRRSESMLQINRGSNTNSLPNSKRRSFREMKSADGCRIGQSIPKVTQTKHNNNNIELDDLTTEIPIERIHSDLRNKEITSSFTNNAYDDCGDDDNDDVEYGRRNNHTAIDRNYTAWYNGPVHSKYGQLNNNTDLLSLHSILSRSNKAKTNKKVWISKLAYSFLGALAWIFITLCIEELDEIPHSSLNNESCSPDQEIRYWASYVCLVAIVTGATIYFEKCNPSQCILVFLLNVITFCSINKAPLSCIRNRGTLVERDIERLRGGFLLFLILAVLAFWITKRYFSSNKTS